MKRTRHNPLDEVAVVCPYSLDRFGGVQAQTIGLVERLRGEGHAAWLVAPGRTGPERARPVGSTITVPANRSSVPWRSAPVCPAGYDGRLTVPTWSTSTNR